MGELEINLNGNIADKKHLYTLIVQYEDTDAGGVVYHSNYLNYAERGRSAFLRCLGIDLNKYLKDEGKTILITRIEIDYLASAQLNNYLTVETSVCKIGKTRLDLNIAKGELANLRCSVINAKPTLTLLLPPPSCSTFLSALFISSLTYSVTFS